MKTPTSTSRGACKKFPGFAWGYLLLLFSSLCFAGPFYLKNTEGAVQMQDSTGEKFSTLYPFSHIVSLNPSATEILFALGAGPQVKGVTSFCDFPAEVKQIPVIGTVMQPDMEKIVSLMPDLLLATKEGNSVQTVRQLRSLGLRVFVLGEVKSFTDLFAQILTIGKLVGRDEESQELIVSLARRIAVIKARLKGVRPVRVFLQMSYPALISANRDTVIGQLLELAGAQNIAKTCRFRYPPYNWEEVIIQDPEAVIVAVMGPGRGLALADWERYPEIAAVRTARFLLLNPDLVCNLGPRLIEGLEAIAQFLHPEEFE